MDRAAESDGLAHVVVIGGGFAGLYAAKSLRGAPVRVTLIDRRNHHLFQPLLYQVATASLSPADIAAPIRHILARQRNTRVLLGEAVAIDVERKRVVLTDGVVVYDTLIVATGVTHSYFGHEEWEPLAPGLKDIPDALEMRRRFLLAFENAERATDPQVRRAKLTFVIVGAGPTGVELAGAMIEIARRAIPKDFRSIDTTTARVILVEGLDRVLPTYTPSLSARAKLDLERLGVEVRLNARVTGIDAGGVFIGEDRIEAASVFWAAGVTGSPLGATIGASVDRSGRVHVERDLSLPGHPEVFVIGDLANVTDANGVVVPGIAPAAMQMGRHVARIIAKEARERGERRTDAVRTGEAPAPQDARAAFRYLDKGMLATIGRAKAVGDVLGMRVAGFIAWAMWLTIHITYLIGFRNRIIVLIQWAWAYFTFDRGARLITGEGAVKDMGETMKR